MNEIRNCKENLRGHNIELVGDIERFPITLKITIRGVPGPDLQDDEVVHRTEHIMVIEISEDYPYTKPLVIWGTPIFHPNIMLPDDGGFVCTKLLDDWTFASNLLSFITGVEALLSNPNPRSPYGTQSCTMAAERFNREPYVPPGGSARPERRAPRIIEEED